VTTTTLIVTNWVPGTIDKMPDQLIHLEHTLTTDEAILDALHMFAVANSIGPVGWDWLVKRIDSGQLPPAKLGITKWWTQRTDIQIVEEDTHL
jgi:hypothetical protein